MSLLVHATRDEDGVELDDDGEYWWLYDTFVEIQRHTGQMIDLYGDAIFGGSQLQILHQALLGARARLDQQPESWEVVVGTRGDSAPVTALVVRASLAAKLDRWLRLVERAARDGDKLVCVGD